MADLKPEAPKESKIDIEQGNVGILTVKLLADIANTLKRIETALASKKK